MKRLLTNTYAITLTAICVIIFLFLNFHSLYNDESGSGAKYYADRIEGSSSSSGPIREYYENVKLFQNNVEINCDYAKLYINQNKSSLKGNVILYQDDLTLITPAANYNGSLKVSETFDSVEIKNLTTYLIADKGYYYSEKNIADFHGNIKIENDSSIVYSDSLKYNKKSEDSFAYGNVKIQGKFSNSVLYADTVNNYPSKNYSYSTGKPLLVQIDTVDNDEEIQFDTMQVSSRVMEAFREKGNERYLFQDSVRIYKNDVKAIAENAIYYKDKDYIELINSPVIWFDSTQIFGDTIRIYFKNKELELIHSIGNSFSSSKNDTTFTKRINQLLGDEIKVNFKNKKIQTIETFGNSKSLYFMFNENGGDGIARNASDNIVIQFENEKPEDIIWLGNNQGEYFPEDILIDEIKSYYLPKFKWENGKPQKIKKEFKNKRQ